MKLPKFFYIKKENYHNVIYFFGIKIKIEQKKYYKEKIQDLEKKISFYKTNEQCLIDNFVNFLPKTSSAKIYFLNDTRRLNNHLGCKIVCGNIENLVRKKGGEIIFFDKVHGKNNLDVSDYKKIIDLSDIILFNGEGTLHNNAGVSMFEKCKIAHNSGKKVYLINSVWQNNKQVEEYLNYIDLISLRESFSFNELPEFAKNKAMVVPDLTFYKEIASNKKKQGIMFTDSVYPDITKKLENMAKRYGAKMYYMKNGYENLLNEEVFLNNPPEYIVTGRFHTLTLAVKYGIPSLAFPSNSHKIEGLLYDAGLNNYLIKDNFEKETETFINSYHKDFIEKSAIYTKCANKKIEELFVEIFKRG